MASLQTAICDSFNRHTMTVLLYAVVNLYILDRVQDRRKQFMLLLLSVFSIEVGVNYYEELQNPPDNININAPSTVTGIVDNSSSNTVYVDSTAQD